MDDLRKLPPSGILQVLGTDLLVPFTAVRIPGQVMWCNFDLAREMGFDVPCSNQMSTGLEEELLQAFSYRTLRPGEAPAGRGTITLFADRYGGKGVGKALGSARGGFFPYCNAFAKGVGFTPLFRDQGPDDFVHSHGGMDMDEALHEALWGEVNLNLFSGKSTRVLALIDQDDITVYPDGSKIPRALTIRVGDPLRPAHLLAKRRWKGLSRLNAFLAIARETGQLVLQTGAGGEPDVRATMLRIVDDHAWMAARQMRWRITHFYLTASNLRMDGGMIDHNTLRSNPRLPPIRPDRSIDRHRTFYRDYIDRALRLTTLYRTLRSSLRDAERQRLNAEPIDTGKAMDAAYLPRLEHELLCASGLKSAVALRVRQERPDVARRFAGVLIEMTGVANRAQRMANLRLISDAAVLDVCNLLAVYPQTFFSDACGTHAEIAWNALAPCFKGLPSQIAKRRAVVEVLVREFIAAYRELMTVCRPFAKEFYGDAKTMRLSIQARASFENRPIDRLYQPTLWQRVGAIPYSRSVRGLMSEYGATKDRRMIAAAIDDLVTDSIRNTEELLRRGTWRRVNGGGWESQILTIDGVRYAIRSGTLHVSFPVEREGSGYRTGIERFPQLSGAAVRRLRFRFTTDAWKTQDEALAVLEADGFGGTHVAFEDLRSSVLVGELQGFLYMRGEEASRATERQPLRNYVFAIPDAIDLKNLDSGSAS